MLDGKGLLTPIQRDFMAFFASLPDQERFYLTGGTALAEFYLGHRLSFDLDFFTTEEPLILPFSRHLEQVCVHRGWSVEVGRRFASYVEFLVTRGEDQLRVELALDSPFRLGPPETTRYGIRVSGRLDLVVDKLLAYYGRAEPRDAVDLYFILQAERLENLLSLAKRKDPGFDLYWFAVALNKARSFPDELDQWPVKVLKHLDPVDLKRQFHELAVSIMAKVDQPPGR